MGGGSSKEESSTTFNEKSESHDIPLKGIRNGDEVIVRGETFGSFKKCCIVNFFKGQDVALHFKVVLLPLEGQYNKIVLNTRVDGRWQKEEIEENVIFLNHHFEVKFACKEGSFEIYVDGAHLHNYSHRVAPETITALTLEGDANWQSWDLPNQVPRCPRSTSAEKSLPTEDEVKLYVQNLNRLVAPTVYGLIPDIGTLFNYIKQGLEFTKTLVGEDKKKFIEKVEKYSGYLEKIFSAGTAIFDLFKFTDANGEPSEMAQLIATLEEINQELKKIEATIEQGFSEVVEHMDFVQLREEVTAPLRTMFDLYTRCYTVRGSVPMNDFKNYCKEKPPRQLFSKMYSFLETKSNIIETHLKTKKYAFSELDEWSDALFSYATKLVVMNMFYYGILCKEHAASGNPNPLINEKDEITDLINQLMRMDGRIKEIEVDRMAKFHMNGIGKEKLRELFQDITYGKATITDTLPLESLSKIAYEIKKKWSGNGPEDYYIMVVSGTKADQLSHGLEQYAGWQLGDPGRVSILEDVGELDVSDSISHHPLSIVLIQPVTQAMKDNNRIVNEKYSEQLRDIVKKTPKTVVRTKDTLDIIQSSISSIPYSPALIMYNTFDDREKLSMDDRHLSPLDVVELQKINYTMTGEAWSNPGGPLPLKYVWRSEVSGGGVAPNVDYLRQVQFLFK